jgi:hypothetical protein
MHPMKTRTFRFKNIPQQLGTPKGQNFEKYVAVV